MGFISNGALGNFQRTGVFLENASPSLIIPTGDSDNVLAIVGCASGGAKDQPIFVSTASSGSAGPIFAAIGQDTTLPFSAARAAISAMPEITQFLFIIRSDGSDVNAASSFLGQDQNPLWLLIANESGSNGNGMTQSLVLQSGSLSLNPVFMLTITYPNRPTANLGNIIGYTAIGTGLDVPTLVTNAVARINGVANQFVAYPYAVASPASGTAQPQLATVFTSSGGADGTTNMTGNLLQGVPSTYGGGTGMYAIGGHKIGGLVLAGNSDMSVAQNVASFLEAKRNGIGFLSFPSSLTTDQYQAIQQENDVYTRRIVPVAHWCYVNDVASGQTNMLVDPASALAAIFISNSPWIDGANKPIDGKLGILGTERTAFNPVDPDSEGATREQSGIMWLTNFMPRGGNFLGAPHGQASDGSNITDTRMYDYCCSLAAKTMGQFVGEGQTPLPALGPDLDRTRRAIKAALNAAFSSEVEASDPHLAAVSITSNQTNARIAQGFVEFDINCTTLSGIKFAVGVVAVGTTVQIISADAVTAAAAVGSSAYGS